MFFRRILGRHPNGKIILFSREISEQIARKIFKYLNGRVIERTVERIPLQTLEL